MVAPWGVTRPWWAATVSWRASRVCSMMPWPAAGGWCCARARRGSARPGWPKSWPRPRRPGTFRWPGPGPPTRVARRRTACGGWSWTNPRSARELICGRASSAPPTSVLTRASPSGSRCSPTCADGWRRRPNGTGCCWCSTTCRGRMRRPGRCSPRSSGSSAGPGSWPSPPTGTRRPRGSCRGCRRRPTPSGSTCTACPPRRSGTCCSPPGWMRHPNRPAGCTPRPEAIRSWSGSWPRR